MTFNDDFNGVLSLIIEKDKRNREKILQFIDSLPIEFCEQINISLNKYYQYEANEVDILDRDDICLCGESMIVDDYKYSFIIDMMLHSLTITKNKKYCSEFNKEFEFTVYAGTRFNNVDNYGKQLLGCLFDVENSSIIHYNLVDTIFGRMFNIDYGILKKYSKVFFDSLSKNIGLNNIDLKNDYSRVRKNI